jgi:hypothetical protein
VLGATSAATCVPVPKVNIVTVAGTGDASFITNNVAATSSDILQPNNVVVDALGNLYIGTGASNSGGCGSVSSSSNCYVQKVSKKTGLIAAVAGKGNCGYFGDGGPATMARVQPYGLALGK